VELKFCGDYFDEFGNLYQSYQSGIEISWVRCFIYLLLFYQSYQSGIEIYLYPKKQNPVNLHTINRTKVELKLKIKELKELLKDFLSIVPKWNWNSLHHIPGTHQPVSINRTKVELKYIKEMNTPGHIYYQSYQSGIEIVLLLRGFQMSDETINRTKVELKLKRSGSRMKSWRLSIVPKWNWNKRYKRLRRDRHNYQSYQSGIEIWNIIRFVEVKYIYQSYQSGIEIQVTFQSRLLACLSIVPKWNWNCLMGQRNWSRKNQLSIVPKWNWNILHRIYSCK